MLESCMATAQVTVYGRARLGHDVFLGEVVIPLREVESMVDVSASPEIRRYILGRRNAKEKASFLPLRYLIFRSSSRWTEQS